jgi:hypothetical protein
VLHESYDEIVGFCIELAERSMTSDLIEEVLRMPGLCGSEPGGLGPEFV